MTVNDQDVVLMTISIADLDIGKLMQVGIPTRMQRML